MKPYQIYISLLSVIFLSIISAQTESSNITNVDFYTIFKTADRNADEKLQHAEVEEAFKEAVILAFRAGNLYFDQDLIDAIVQDLKRQYSSEYHKEDFRAIFNEVPVHVHKFRDDIFKELISIYKIQDLVHELASDSEADRHAAIPSEIGNNAGVYGLTYAAYKVLKFNFDNEVRKADIKPSSAYGAGTGYGRTGTSSSGSTRSGTASDRRKASDRVGTRSDRGSRRASEPVGSDSVGYTQPINTNAYVYETRTADQPGTQTYSGGNTYGSGQGDAYLQTPGATNPEHHHTGKIIEETITKKIEIDTIEVPTPTNDLTEPKASHVTLEVEAKTVYRDDL